MGHYDCKYCDASPGEEHSADCERFQPMTNPKHTDTSRSGDLVERLRGFYCGDMGEPADPINPDGPEAADRIEALEAENERLREALDNIANESSDTWAREKARAALAGDSHDQ